jgi:hypothetical protein
MVKRRWTGCWRYGLLGAGVLSVGTGVKVVERLLFDPSSGLPWRELPGFGLTVFLMGFVCGCVAWAVRFLPVRLGRVGDALMGLFVMDVFFLCCMAAFDRSLLTDNGTNGMLMLALGSVAGAVLGGWVGHDLRKWIKNGMRD